MTEDYTYHGPMLTGRHPHIGPMPADATVLQPAEMAALRASLAAVEAALVEAEAERARRQKLADQLAADNRQIEQLSLDLSRATGAAGGASARADAAERERDDLRGAYALERQRAEAAEAERVRLVALLEGLTPGGSEFQGDPIRCAAWITDRLAGVVRQVEKRKAAEAQLAAVPVEALRRYFEFPSSSFFNAANERADADAIREWLSALPEVQP